MATAASTFAAELTEKIRPSAKCTAHDEAAVECSLPAGRATGTCRRGHIHDGLICPACAIDGVFCADCRDEGFLYESLTIVTEVA